jgi:hypothetical protein
MQLEGENMDEGLKLRVSAGAHAKHGRTLRTATCPPFALAKRGSLV